MRRPDGPIQRYTGRHDGRWVCRIGSLSTALSQVEMLNLKSGSVDELVYNNLDILIKQILQVGKTFIMKIKLNTTNKDSH